MTPDHPVMELRTKAPARFEDGKSAKPPHAENGGTKRCLKLPCFGSRAALRKECRPLWDGRVTPGARESGEYGRYRFAPPAS